MSENSGHSGLFLKAAVLIAAAAVVWHFTIGTYNSLVSMRENTSEAWSQVENVCQRRLDLIPNLVNTVKGYAAHEEKIFSDITETRSKAGGVIQLDSSITDSPEKMAEFSKIQNELGAGLQRLLAVSENYPVLKSNENFLALQNELEGTENRISVERKRYNEAVKKYNTGIKKWPANIIARKYSFEEKAYFEAAPKSTEVPEISF